MSANSSSSINLQEYLHLLYPSYSQILQLALSLLLTSSPTYIYSPFIIFHLMMINGACYILTNSYVLLQKILTYKYLLKYSSFRQRVDCMVYRIENRAVMDKSSISGEMARGSSLRLAEKLANEGLCSIGIDNMRAKRFYNAAKTALERLIADSGYSVKNGILVRNTESDVDDIRIAVKARSMLEEANLALNGLVEKN